MRVHSATIQVETTRRSFVDVTAFVNQAVSESGLVDGLCNVFVSHTSASLLISENADPDVLRDLERFMSELVPDGDPRFRHTAEGPDDMSAHVRSVLTATSVSVPVRSGRLSLGTWQAIYLWEHRQMSHRRRLEVTVLG